MIIKGIGHITQAAAHTAAPVDVSAIKTADAWKSAAQTMVSRPLDQWDEAHLNGFKSLFEVDRELWNIEPENWELKALAKAEKIAGLPEWGYNVVIDTRGSFIADVGTWKEHGSRLAGISMSDMTPNDFDDVAMLLRRGKELLDLEVDPEILERIYRVRNGATANIYTHQATATIASQLITDELQWKAIARDLLTLAPESWDQHRWNTLFSLFKAPDAGNPMRDIKLPLYNLLHRVEDGLDEHQYQMVGQVAGVFIEPPKTKADWKTSARSLMDKPLAGWTQENWKQLYGLAKAGPDVSLMDFRSHHLDAIHNMLGGGEVNHLIGELLADLNIKVHIDILGEMLDNPVKVTGYESGTLGFSQAMVENLIQHASPHREDQQYIRTGLVQAKNGVELFDPEALGEVAEREINHLVDQILVKIDRNIDRIDKKLKDGYANFPDYAELGEVATDIQILKMLVDNG